MDSAHTEVPLCQLARNSRNRVIAVVKLQLSRHINHQVAVFCAQFRLEPKIKIYIRIFKLLPLNIVSDCFHAVSECTIRPELQFVHSILYGNKLSNVHVASIWKSIISGIKIDKNCRSLKMLKNLLKSAAISWFARTWCAHNHLSVKDHAEITIILFNPLK